MRTKLSDNEIYRLEKKYPDLLFIPSKSDGIFYATSSMDNRIGIVTTNGIILLTEEQAHNVAKEIREICALYIGRGRIHETRGRWHL